jgi:hypothetical protein
MKKLVIIFIFFLLSEKSKICLSLIPLAFRTGVSLGLISLIKNMKITKLEMANVQTESERTKDLFEDVKFLSI